MDRDIILSELETLRTKLLDMINNKVDVLTAAVKNGEPIDDGDSSAAERLCPLSIRPDFFKGTKPTALHFGDEIIPVKTWRRAYALILERCAGIPEKCEALMSLRNKISGKKRVILSDKSDGMDVPIKIAEDIFVEGYFDTEWLVRILTTELLDAVSYDYSDISVSVVKSKRGGNRYL